MKASKTIAMSAPLNTGPSGYQPRAGQQSGNSSTLVIVLAILGCTMFAFCAGLGLLGAAFYSRVKAKAGRIPPPFAFPPQPAPAPLIAPAWQTEWIANAQLTPVYTAAIDAVVKNKDVLEKLGEPIETSSDPDTLFRREKSGDWTGADEVIEFDVSGPKGTAVVRVAAGANTQPPGPYRSMWPKTITATLTDGTEIDVPPPSNNTEPPEQ